LAAARQRRLKRGGSTAAAAAVMTTTIKKNQRRRLRQLGGSAAAAEAEIINKLLPNGEVGWEVVATAYFNQPKEKVLYNTTDVRRHWIKNLCNNMQKLTGKTGENNDWIHQCMLI
jgi:hypothetical protein